MQEISFSGLVVVAAIALLAPLALGLVPRLRLPAVVLEIVAGIVVGPAVLDWVETDTVIRVFALFGLAFLLFLAGLEIEFDRLRGTPLKLAGLGFVVSFAIALAVGFGLEAAGQVESGTDRGDHPLGDVARGRRAAAQGRGRGREPVRPAHDRRRPRSRTSRRSSS